MVQSALLRHEVKSSFLSIPDRICLYIKDVVERRETTKSS